MGILQILARMLAGKDHVGVTSDEKKFKVEAEVRYWAKRADNLKARVDLSVDREQ